MVKPAPITQLLHFTYHEAMSCIFPVVIFVTLAVSDMVNIPFFPRYDFILLVCLLMQFAMIYSGLETMDELKVICVFHLIGLALELYKVHMGSWSYPEEAWTKIYGVPLYSGFMYASVASYLCQAWRRLDVNLHNWPPSVFTVAMGSAIYFNFFSEHFIYDFRWVLTALLVVLFFRTHVTFSIRNITYRMPLLLTFFLTGFFIWIAENIATFFGAWQYPGQAGERQVVHVGKISSWMLLVIVSFIIVAQLKHVKNHRKVTEPKEGALHKSVANDLWK